MKINTSAVVNATHISESLQESEPGSCKRKAQQEIRPAFIE
jgi:hypothetical protein